MPQDGVDDPREFLRDKGAHDQGPFRPAFGQVPALDLGIVLNRPHGGVTEREFEMAIAVLGVSVAGLPAGVLGARDSGSRSRSAAHRGSG